MPLAWLLIALLGGLVSARLRLKEVVIVDSNKECDAKKWDRLFAKWDKHYPCNQSRAKLSIYTVCENVQLPVNFHYCFPKVVVETGKYGIDRVFDLLLENEGGHTLMLNLDTVPVVNNWLDASEDLIQSPDHKFWMKTGLDSRSSEYSPVSISTFYHHFLPVGLFNFVPEFRDFYRGKISRQLSGEILQFPRKITRYLYDATFAEEARNVFHRFVVDDFILDARRPTLFSQPDAIFKLIE